ncbi:MAG: NAD(+) diphosphatase [Hyphomonas sp.]
MANSNLIPLGARPIERAAHRRTDTAWLDAATTSDDVLIFLMQGGMPLLEGPSSGVTPRPGDRVDGGIRPLLWLGPEALKLSEQTRTIFMGEDKNGSPIFALDMPESFSLDGSMIEGLGAFEDMRAASTWLSLLESNLASTARSMLMWHDTHMFCSRCGDASVMAEAGWKRQCSTCKAEHFPRTDPVAIMVVEKDDKCLLGRQKMWPQGFWSCLAGFCEPGETIEQAACREVFEEAGIEADPANVEYIACQPWPFPSSLMVGVIVKAETEDISIDENELEAARWITRAEARDVLAGTHPDIMPWPDIAVAHHILKEWAERD